MRSCVGSYTSPGDVRLNVLGPSVNVNGSSQISGLLRADNATVSISGIAQIRGQVIADSIALNGGQVIGSVWPAHSGSSITTFWSKTFRSNYRSAQSVSRAVFSAGNRNFAVRVTHTEWSC